MAVLCLQLKLRREEQRQLHADRIRKVTDVHYVVRNAVSVLAFYGRQCPDQNASRSIGDAVDRINSALREILPPGWNLSPAADQITVQGKRSR